MGPPEKSWRSPRPPGRRCPPQSGFRGCPGSFGSGVRAPLTPTRRGLFRPERALGSALLRLEGLEGSCELREQLEVRRGRRGPGVPPPHPRRGLFRPERALGSALLRLEGLEGSCELREQLELLDGRRRTGGRLEVRVRVREPLGARRQLEPRCERWLVLEPAPEATLAVPKPSAAAPKDGNNRPLPTLPSLNLLHFDRERLERKMAPFGRAGRPVPPELRQQHQELQRRIQGLGARLQGGDPHFRTEYAEHLQRHLRLYTEAARRLGTQGERVGETPAQPSPPSRGNPPRPPGTPPDSEGSAPKILEQPRSLLDTPKS
ncbi:coiled-coil and C2 domain-containing protein 1A-like, partial [Onychostruthus taczanowskii]|uniref:coiled-coil and C2 domain-containing protein 1A-like n=1 Tax=Onychostruthus taczanowskii TaxID=356909 RepID=UPI001B808E7D